jgi:hypothetical protein
MVSVGHGSIEYTVLEPLTNHRQFVMTSELQLGRLNSRNRERSDVSRRLR